MVFQSTPLPDVYLIEPEPHADSRGHFARLWCLDELRAYGIDHNFVQANFSVNERRGTLRGLHRQRAPHGEAKLIHCSKGALFDVVVDTRPSSPTYLAWFGAELSAENRRAMYVPVGCTHGYLSLTDGAEAHYVVSHPYVPGVEAGIRYDDPCLDIQWPIPVEVVSEKDRSWPDLREQDAVSSAER
jgi:dTDP-4-dehydrorhamnose 3,5-epimerase